jgi:hypothetical protein
MAIIDGADNQDPKMMSALSSDSKLATGPDEIVALPDSKNQDQDELKYQSLIAYITKEYTRAKNKRRWDEERWIQSYNNYRGLYNTDVKFSDAEVSQAFIKVTKTKVNAAHAQILDILFAANKFPIGVEESPIPTGVAEAVHYDPKEPDKSKDVPSPVARPDITAQLGPYKEKLDSVKDKIKDGPGLTPTSSTWFPAQEAAKNMEKLIHDQLLECGADKAIRSAVHEMCLFGTGLLRGPFLLNKEYPRWDAKGSYNPLVVKTSDVEFLSIWDAYPDPDARNMPECEKFTQRRRMSSTDMRNLKRRPDFRSEAIEKAVTAGTNYVKEYWENTLEDYETHDKIDRYEVLEYWGIVDKRIAEEAELELPEKFADKDHIQINAWVCNGYVLRLVLNQFTPARIPYHACPYELNPYSFFGIGVAENMEDTQLLMNGFMRMAVDNAAKSGNVMLEVDDNMLVSGQDFSMYPGKIWRRNGGQPGQAIHAIQVPNVSNENMMMFDRARELADEATGIPSYSHGQTNIQNVNRTAAGMSMLMGAAAQNIKAVVRNIDDYMLVPLGKAMFAFNMQFNFDPKFVGDLEVVARGTESLMRNEVRSQKLLQFLQIASNPMDAPFVKRDVILRELCKDLDLDPDKIVNDPREAAIQAALMQQMNQLMGIQPGQNGPPTPQGGQTVPGNPAAVPTPQDTSGTGGGNIAPGNNPSPQSPGFSGSTKVPPKGPGM